MEPTLEKLFESVPKIRVLRLFMQNPDICFAFPEIIKKTRTRYPTVRSELKKFLKIGLLKRKTIILREEIIRKSRPKKKSPEIIVKAKKIRAFCINPDFSFLQELRNLFAKATVSSRKKLIQRVSGLGKIKLAVLSGIFINNDTSRTDLLVVGDNVKKTRLDKFLSQIESELGRSLNYTVMDSKEFKYRLDMYDRFLRDILEYPHEKLINKLKI